MYNSSPQRKIIISNVSLKLAASTSNIIGFCKVRFPSSVQKYKQV